MTQLLILGLDIMQVKHFHLELLKNIKHFFLAKTKIIRHLPKRLIMAKAPFEIEQLQKGLNKSMTNLTKERIIILPKFQP
jgi:hypothetical protein